MSLAGRRGVAREAFELREEEDREGLGEPRAARAATAQVADQIEGDCRADRSVREEPGGSQQAREPLGDCGIERRIVARARGLAIEEARVGFVVGHADVDDGEAALQRVRQAMKRGAVPGVHRGDHPERGQHAVGGGRLGADRDAAPVVERVGHHRAAAAEHRHPLAECAIDVGAVELVDEQPAAIGDGREEDASAEMQGSVALQRVAAEGVERGPVGRRGGRDDAVAVAGRSRGGADRQAELGLARARRSGEEQVLARRQRRRDASEQRLGEIEIREVRADVVGREVDARAGERRAGDADAR